MFDDRERQILSDLFCSDTPMYLHRLSDYAAMFDVPGESSTPESRRQRAHALLTKLGVLDDVIGRDSSERSMPSVDTAILGAGTWAENMSGGEITRIAPAPDDEVAPCKAGGEHAFRLACEKCGVTPKEAAREARG